MNNAKIIYDNNFQKVKVEKEEFLLKQQGEMTQIVEAINRIEANEDWQKLKKLVLNGVVETLERQLKNESERKEVNAPELYRLQGQLVWARKYVDLKKLAEFFKQQLENIKLQLKHGKQNPEDGAS
mgnify:CR=1 FL=1